ncbi:LrgB family protein [Pseudorhodoferax sp.]|uniref:LrgB family protein n=1 Tax=Pseudorhodoferax sp. TaxID=1993553 RepID=UPI002DD6248B|nr:LrgB family protein [Pseudorhodoferax sp.]
MNELVELWLYLSASPLFGLAATVAVYVLATGLSARWGQPPWANPVLWSVLALAGLLLAGGIPYSAYFAGAQFIHFLLGPAVVALGWLLWQRREALRRRAPALLLAALAGGAAAAGSAVALALLLGLPADVVVSLAPKSVTAPVAMAIAERSGGVPALAAVFAVLTGLVGAVTAPYLFTLLRITEPALRGFALGTTSHGIGAARALQVHPEAGAFAGLAFALQAVLAALLLPLALTLFL